MAITTKQQRQPHGHHVSAQRNPLTDTPCRGCLMRVQVDAMRRTAALASAITLLTACSGGDIVVKTDLDEKYIIKKSAVTKIDMNWDEYKELIEYRRETNEKGMASTRKYWDKCLGKDGSYPLSEEYCRNSWSKFLILPKMSFLN